MTKGVEHIEKQFDLAIVICTYNPDKKIFARLLDAVNNLQYSSNPARVECIIIDNNSHLPLTESEYVVEFLNKCPFQTKVILEKKQGLTAARVAGVQNSSAPIIVFFDDDNEPKSTYLEELYSLYDKYPFVGVWGPGDIHVDFLEPVPSDKEGWMRGVFQEKHLDSMQYALTTTWTPAHPFGTGLSIRRLAIKTYLEAVLNNRYSLSDRKGNSLASAGDTQIVLQAILDGWAVGASPSLQLVHIIPPHRTTLKYLKKLMYEVAISSKKALIELMPEEKKHVATLGRLSFIKKITHYIFNRVLRRSSFFLQIHMANYLGNISASYYILGKKPPKRITFFVKKIIY
ncbi:glycosyltransferase [uncultured Microscilla sp.]|uniref:glycosyltransferase n=1 Tax=uncultured Microscilla sp. TaxID=432653 RepID=UPI0026303598|nr:glycosyltransferase [uncultured Microscilla sp.]